MNTHMGSRGRTPLIPNLCTRWKWVVNFMPQLLYPQGKEPQYPLNKRLGGPQSWSGHFWRKEKKNPLHLHRFKPWTIQPVVHSLYWLHYPGSLMVISSYSILEKCINYCSWKQSRTLSAVLSMCSDHWTLDEYDRILQKGETNSMKNMAHTSIRRQQIIQSLVTTKYNTREDRLSYY